MQNLTPSDLADLVNQCETIALRFVNQNVRQKQVLELAQFLKFQTRWRLVSYSEKAAETLWDELRVGMGADVHDLVISMAGEFTFRYSQLLYPRGDYRTAPLIDAIGTSLSWLQKSAAVTKEEKDFTATAAEYAKVFSNNPWLTFLYLLSMSDIVNRVYTLQLVEAT